MSESLTHDIIDIVMDITHMQRVKDRSNANNMNENNVIVHAFIYKVSTLLQITR